MRFGSKDGYSFSKKVTQQKRQERDGRCNSSSEQLVHTSCGCSAGQWSNPEDLHVLENVLLASSDPRHHSWTERSGRIDGAPINRNEERVAQEHGQTNCKACHRRIIKIGVHCRLQHGEDKQESHHELTHQSVPITPRHRWNRDLACNPSPQGTSK